MGAFPTIDIEFFANVLGGGFHPININVNCNRGCGFDLHTTFGLFLYGNIRTTSVGTRFIAGLFTVNIRRVNGFISRSVVRGNLELKIRVWIRIWIRSWLLCRNRQSE